MMIISWNKINAQNVMGTVKPIIHLTIYTYNKITISHSANLYIYTISGCILASTY